MAHKTGNQLNFHNLTLQYSDAKAPLIGQLRNFGSRYGPYRPKADISVNANPTPFNYYRGIDVDDDDAQELAEQTEGKDQ